MDADGVAELRVEYESAGIDEETLGPDPVAAFEQWFDEVTEVGVTEANTFVLATAGTDGRPGARAVLMKGFSAQGIVFYTNRRSRKGDEMAVNPRVAACFVWLPVHRQVRVEGIVEPVDDGTSDRYFESRPVGSRLSAAASPQSQVVPDRAYLEERYRRLELQHPDGDVPRPHEWGGYRLVPDFFEFWQGRPHRFHDRICFHRTGEAWRAERLAP